jgi:NAD+ synthase
MYYKQAVDNIRAELKEYVQKARLKSLVLGISGGIDSTLVALLAKPVCNELNIPLIGRSLPSSTNTKGENQRARKIGKMFCTDFKETSIKGAFNKLADLAHDNHNVLPFNYPDGEEGRNQIPNGNIKARIRMILLYDLAGSNNGMVLSTDNYTEYLLGFWTLHGDSPYDWGPIQEMWKTEVYEMAEWITNNESSIDEKDAIIEVLEADATDGLGITSTDLDQIMPGWEGSSRYGYDKVDKILQQYITYNCFNDNCPVIKRHLRTQFKRDWPIFIKRENILRI